LSKEKTTLADIMRDRQIAYRQVFGTPDSPAHKLVLQDLNRFCRATDSTFHTDERVHCLLEGRREVVLRIHDYMTLSVDELCNKHGRKDFHG
jgi:hypothetical protein